MPSVAVRLDADMKARLEKLGKAKDRSPHYLMKEAIEAYVHEQEAKDEVFQTLVTRWKNYELTGETVSGASVKAWIDALPDGDRTP